jgi:hypothetical protein
LGIKEIADKKAITIYQCLSDVLSLFGQKIEDVGMILTDNACDDIKCEREASYESLKEGKITEKWIGCANYSFSQAVNLLQTNECFREHYSIVLNVFQRIKSSASANKDFLKLSGRSIVLPYSTR